MGQLIGQSFAVGILIADSIQLFIRTGGLGVELLHPFVTALNYKAAIVEEALRDLGYIIEPEYLFRKMVKMVENRSFDIEFLQKAINALMESTIGNDSQEDFDGLFSDMQLDSTKLGHTVKDRSAVMAKIIASLDEINFSVDDTKIDPFLCFSAASVCGAAGLSARISACRGWIHGQRASSEQCHRR